MSKVYIKVEALFGMTTKREGIVTIDRASKTISVRERFGREEFILPLDEVADIISLKVLQAKALSEIQSCGTKRRRVRRVSRGLLTTGR